MKSLKKTIVVMAIVAVSAAITGISQLSGVTAFAQTDPVQSDVLASVSMVPGASIRVADITESDVGNGLRFSMQMDKADYDVLMTGETYSDQEFGIIIVPHSSDYDDVNYDTVFGDSKKYDWAVWDAAENKWTYTGTADDEYTQIMLYSFNEMYTNESDTNGETVRVNATVSKIQNAVIEFRGIGYVKYKDGDVQKHKFLDAEVRSMTYVAQRAIEDGNENAEWIQAKYVDVFEKDGAHATTTSVTQEYYFEQEDGTYAIDSELTETVSTVGENDIYINDVVTADSAHVENYVYNPDHQNSVKTGKAYANGKLTLKSYYKKFDVANVINKTSLFTANRTNYEAEVHGTLTVDEYDTEVADRLNKDIKRKAQYKIDLPKYDNNLGDATVSLQLKSDFMSKSALQEMIDEGYYSLSFYAYRQLDMGEYTWENSVYIRTIDFDKMRSGSPKVSDTRETIKATYCTSSALLSYATNTWRKVEYSLSDLLEFYDVLFAANTNYYIAEIGAGTNNVDNNVLYLSKFTLNKVDFSNVVDDPTLFTVKLNNWWVANNMNTSGLTSKTVNSYEEVVTNPSDATISKKSAYKIILPDTSSDPSGSTSAMVSLSREFVSKAVLKKLVADGYKTLNFSVYREVGSAGEKFGLYFRKIDFDKMRNPQDKTTDSAGKEIDNPFKNKYYSTVSGLNSNKWVDVSYNLSDLIEFYDVLFKWGSDYFIFEISAGYPTTNNNVYISAFEISK